MALLILAVALVRLYFYLGASRKETLAEPRKYDLIKTEYVIMGITGMIVLWSIALEEFLWSYYRDMVFTSIGMFLISVPMAGICLAGGWLLIRKRQRGLLKETSYLWQIYRNNRKETPETEQQHWRRQKPFYYVETFCFIVALVYAGMMLHNRILYHQYQRSYSVGGELIVITIVAVTAGIVTAVFHYQQECMLTDLRTLRWQLEAMEQGDFISSFQVREASPVYPIMEMLLRIRDNLSTAIDRQMRDERMKVELITNVSHDLKTPLTAMVGYIDLLKKEELNPAAKDYVDVLAARHEQLGGIIQDVFELSKVTSGVEELELEELDMRRLLEQTLADMEEAIQSADIDIKKRFTKDPVCFMGDGKKVYRIIQNLLENALKYSLKGTRIYLELKQEEGEVQVLLCNTVSYEMTFTEEEIVERFTRGDASRHTEGNGLGLAIAHSFTRAMGGSFRVKPDGDQFRVMIGFKSVAAD